jgi:thioredoxin 1
MSTNTHTWTEANFDSELARSEGTVVVDFWAQWCAPCKALAPTLDALAGEYAGRATVVKVDIDQEAGLAARFQVQSIPTLLFFRDGELVDRVVGNTSAATLRTKIDSFQPA